MKKFPENLTRGIFGIRIRASLDIDLKPNIIRCFYLWQAYTQLHIDQVLCRIVIVDVEHTCLSRNITRLMGFPEEPTNKKADEEG